MRSAILLIPADYGTLKTPDFRAFEKAMAPDDFQDSALAKALKRQKELQETIKAATDTIKVAMQELEKLRQFTEMYRSLATDKKPGEKETLAPVLAKLGGAAHGETQTVFQTLALDILRDVGRPMRSVEFIEEFRKRGHPLGGNEVRKAWNRLWEARANGLLSHIPNVGYWIAGEPLSEEAKQEAQIAAGKRRRSGTSAVIQAARGTKIGRHPLWGKEQIEAAERMLLAGKSRAEVAAALGGVSMGTLQKYVSISGLKEKYPDVVTPKRPRRPRQGKRAAPRPRVLTPDKTQQITKMKAEGKTVKEITDALGLKQSTVYRYLQEQRSTKNSE